MDWANFLNNYIVSNKIVELDIIAEILQNTFDRESDGDIGMNLWCLLRFFEWDQLKKTTKKLYHWCQTELQKDQF